MSDDLPRLKENDGVVNPQTGKALRGFSRFWDAAMRAINAKIENVVSATTSAISVIVSGGVATITVDATLAALAQLNSAAGFLVQTAADTFTKRTLQAGTGISITNPSGVAGDPTISLAGTVGDFSGPAIAVADDFVQFADPTGKLGKDGGLSRDIDGTFAANSDTKIPSQKAVKTYADAGDAAALASANAYTDTVANGRSWKNAVRAATTVAGTLATSFENGDTIDGVVLATFDRILIKNQASAAENGIYTVNFSGAPTRASDADTGAELVDASCYVSEGSTLADTQWTCTANAPIVIGVTSLPFVQSGSGATYTADGVTLQLSGTTFSIKAGGVGTTELAAGAATYAKMQDVSATSRILGRKTSGAGVIEELTLSEVLDFIGSAARGDVIYRGASSWARLAAGTSGLYLKTLGASADPVWDTPPGTTVARRVRYGTSPPYSSATTLYSAGFAVGILEVVPDGGSLSHIGIVAGSASATTNWRGGVYSDSSLTMNSKLADSNLVNGIVQGFNLVALTSAYVNNTGGPVAVWLTIATDTANFSMLNTGASSTARLWNNSGSTLPSTASAQSTSTAAWSIFGFGLGGT